MSYKLVIIVGSIVFALGLAVLSRPATAVCVFANDKNITEHQTQIIHAAQSRISSRFGPLKSQAVVYFFDAPDSYWPLTLNTYGSTSFLGYKTCVSIGPNGQNVDVVAHELMHAEIASRTGFLKRMRTIPIWFDEGLAMQVDFREKYTVTKNSDISLVTKLETGREFFTADREQLTAHYSAAKAVVEELLVDVNDADVFTQLEQLGNGGAFDSILLGKN